MRETMPDILPWDAQKIGALSHKLCTGDASPTRPLRFHNIVKELNQLMHSLSAATTAAAWLWNR